MSTNTEPFTTADTASLGDALRELTSSGGSPGGVIICGSADGQQQVITGGSNGPETGNTPADPRTVYDIASLTKVTVTWPLAGQAVAAGLISLDSPIREFLPPVPGDAPSGQVTIRQILTHTSGLAASTRLDLYVHAGVPLHELICREPLEGPPGQHRYINRGFILLGLALAHVSRRPLQDLAAAMWQAAGMADTAYGPVGRSNRIAPAEQMLPGAPRIWGAAHDTNAALMGGVAGHAGVFSTRLLTSYVASSPDGDWLRRSMTPQAVIEPGTARGLAWIVTGDGRQVAYHHGFTGTSLYLSPGRGRYIVICTNAIYYGRPGERLRPLRDLALKTAAA
jgi:CubicO group peptidase (beta-lactamase class C family)